MLGFRKGTWVGQVPAPAPSPPGVIFPSPPGVTPRPLPDPTLPSAPAPADEDSTKGFLRMLVALSLFGAGGALIGRAIAPKYTLLGAGAGLATRFVVGPTVGPWIRDHTESQFADDYLRAI